MGMVKWVGECVKIIMGGKIREWILIKKGKMSMERGGMDED